MRVDLSTDRLQTCRGNIKPQTNIGYTLQDHAVRQTRRRVFRQGKRLPLDINLSLPLFKISTLARQLGLHINPVAQFRRQQRITGQLMLGIVIDQRECHIRESP